MSDQGNGIQFQLTNPPGFKRNVNQRLELTRAEFVALQAIILDRAIASSKPGFDATTTWVDVLTGQVVTLGDLLSLVTNQLLAGQPSSVEGNGQAPTPHQQESQEPDPEKVEANGLGLTVGTEGEDQEADDTDHGRKPYIH